DRTEAPIASRLSDGPFFGKVDPHRFGVAANPEHNARHASSQCRREQRQCRHRHSLAQLLAAGEWLCCGAAIHMTALTGSTSRIVIAVATRPQAEVHSPVEQGPYISNWGALHCQGAPIADQSSIEDQ